MFSPHLDVHLLLLLLLLLSTGARRQVEDIGRPDGRPDHQRRAGLAPSRRLCVRAGSGRLEGNLRLRQRLRPEGDAIGTAEGKVGTDR